MPAAIPPELLKNAVKQALVEMLDERRDVLRDILGEALEDFALAAAIDEGLRTPPVDRDAVFSLLQDDE